MRWDDANHGYAASHSCRTMPLTKAPRCPQYAPALAEKESDTQFCLRRGQTKRQVSSSWPSAKSLDRLLYGKAEILLIDFQKWLQLGPKSGPNMQSSALPPSAYSHSQAVSRFVSQGHQVFILMEIGCVQRLHSLPQSLPEHEVILFVSQ